MKWPWVTFEDLWSNFRINWSNTSSADGYSSLQFWLDTVLIIHSSAVLNAFISHTQLTMVKYILFLWYSFFFLRFRRYKKFVRKQRIFVLSVNFLFSAKVFYRKSSDLEKHLEIVSSIPLNGHSHTSLLVLLVHSEQSLLQLDSGSSALWWQEYPKESDHKTPEKAVWKTIS